MKLGRRFSRLTTNAVVARPGLWGLFRGPLRGLFDRMAPAWDGMRRPDALAPLEPALDALPPPPPARVLDLGTGTGAAAFVVASRFSEADVVGVDIAEEMLAQARRNTPPELAGRVHFETADAARLPFDDGAFELVSLANMIPFFDELARVTAQGGWIVLTFSAGPETPIWVPPERLRDELARRGFGEFANFQASLGTAFLARKGEPV
jgi:ubiquinone/menaquinone biosynthesis C-methylase UbiE